MDNSDQVANTKEELLRKLRMNKVLGFQTKVYSSQIQLIEELAKNQD